MGGPDGSADGATAQVAYSCRCLRCAPGSLASASQDGIDMDEQQHERPFTVAIAVGGDECVAHGHALFDLQQALVCEDCSKVAAEAARRGIDPESAVEDFRRRPAN